MTELRAFVGHSFSEEDAPLTRTFLDIFSQIEGLLPNFTWTHAKQAQPNDLASKVLTSLENTNVFIGICTKKERVISPSKLKRSWFRTDQLLGAANEFGWKTSDWVIQEIGLAVGRGMSIVILLEEACRKPGGLQGDTEYIPFNRDRPEKAIGPLLEMLRELSPPLRQSLSAPQDGTADAGEPETPAGIENATPDSSWDQARFESAYIWKLVSKDTDGAVVIENTRLDAVKNDPEKSAEWRAITEFWKLRFSDNGNLNRLKALAAEYPANAAIQEKLGSAYSNFEHYDEAYAAFERAAGANADNPASYARLKGSAALNAFKCGHLKQSNKYRRTPRKFVRLGRNRNAIT